MEEDQEVGVVNLPACRIVTLPELCQQGGALANAQVRFIARCAPPRPSARLRKEGAEPVARCPRAQTASLRRDARAARRLKTIDCVRGIAMLEDRGLHVLVDTSQLGAEHQLSRVDGLYSVMGEVEVEDAARGMPLVRARLSRVVDGLDTSLWEQALAIRRQYDARVPRTSGCPAETLS